MNPNTLFWSICLAVMPTISNINFGKNNNLDNFVFLLPSPSKQCWETMIKTCVKLCYLLATLCRGRWGIFKHIFKISIIFFSLILSNVQKKKDEALLMLFQLTWICINKSDKATQYMMNIMTGNGTKMTHKMSQ